MQYLIKKTTANFECILKFFGKLDMYSLFFFLSSFNFVLVFKTVKMLYTYAYKGTSTTSSSTDSKIRSLASSVLSFSYSTIAVTSNPGATDFSGFLTINLNF